MKHHTATATISLPICLSISRRIRRRAADRSWVQGTESPFSPRFKVEVPARRKKTKPQRQLRAIDDYAQDVELGLEEDGQQREQVAGGVDADKDEGYPADGPVQIDVPVVAQYARCQQGGGEGGH